jgi:uncharacterized protein
MSATVTVQGSSVVPAQPDEVEIGIEVSYIDQTAEQALAEVARRSGRIENVFAELGIGRDRWTTSGIAVREHTEWDRKSGEHVHRGYSALTRLMLRLNDAALVGRLMNEAIGRANARVEGPWWRIAPTNPSRVEACRRAAEDARRKAEGYASAFGMRLGAVIEITEPGINVGPSRSSEHSRGLMVLADEPLQEVNVQAGSLDVTANVIVTFALQPG